MARFCIEELGAYDIKFTKEGGDQEKDNYNGDFQDLPIFLNKGVHSMGQLLFPRINFKRGIQEWRHEDLSQLELGYREYHSEELPVVTLDKIICSVKDDNIPYSAFVDVGILREGIELISSESIGFVYRQRTKGIVYLERAHKYKESSSFSFEAAANSLIEGEELTLRLTLRLSNDVFEDFEFNLTKFMNTFYVKTISYIDFFDKRFVLVAKSLKLHDCPIYDDFTEAFELQNIYIDDFYSSRIVMPHFPPNMLAPLDTAILDGKLTGAYLDEDSVQDGYINHFYQLLFDKMRYHEI